MPADRDLFHLEIRVIVTVLLAVVLESATSPLHAAIPSPSCSGATVLALDSEWHGYDDNEDLSQLFRLEVPVPGVLSLEIASEASTTTSESGIPAELDLSADGCGEPGEATILRPEPARLVLAVSTPGTWFIRARVGEPGRPLGLYTLITRFIAARLEARTFSSGHALAGAPDEPTPGNPETGDRPGERIVVTRFYDARAVAKSDPMEVDPDPGVATPLQLRGGAFSDRRPTPSSRSLPDRGLLLTILTLRLASSGEVERVILLP